MAQKYRVLEVKLNSANLSSEKKAKRYAIVSIDNLKHRTKVVCSGSTTVWDQKFCFYVSQSFLTNKNASVTIDLYREGMFSDTLIGKSICSLGLLVEQKPENESESGSWTEKECKYDESDEESLYFDFYDDQFYENGDTCEEEEEDEEEVEKLLPMKASAKVEDVNGLEEEEVEKKLLPMTASAKVEVVNGLKVKGKLDVEMVVQEGDISVDD